MESRLFNYANINLVVYLSDTIKVVIITNLEQKQKSA